MTAGERWLVVGGAGFIGSHFVDRLLGSGGAAGVTVYDNFSSGREWHLEQHGGDERLAVQRADVGDLETLTTVMRGHDAVIHLASNPDIARAAVEPTIDFDQGTVLTQNVVEAMRVTEHPADPLRVRQRRVRRPRRDRDRRGPGAAAADLHLRREQARRRGADLGVRGDVRPPGTRVPVRQRRRPAPDPRRRLRLRPFPPRRPGSTAHPRRRIAAQVVHPRARRRRRRAARRRAQARTPTTSTTSRPGTTSPSPRSRTSPPRPWG